MLRAELEDLQARLAASNKHAREVVYLFMLPVEIIQIEVESLNGQLNLHL